MVPGITTNGAVLLTDCKESRHNKCVICLSLSLPFHLAFSLFLVPNFITEIENR